MGKILDKIVQDDAAPSRSDLWLDGETLKANIHGKWKSISGGGSGAGVTIVDSVDKLDENAPVGSMAVVASREGKYQTFSEITESLPIIDSSMSNEESMELFKQLPIIADIKFNIPKPIPSDLVIQGAVALISNDFIDNGGNMNSSSLLLIAVQNQGVVAMGMMDGQMSDTLIIMQINEETQSFELNDTGINNFNQILNQKTWIFAGDILSAMIGETTPESIGVMDEIFLFLSNNTQADLFIKKGQWQDPYESKFNNLQAKIDAKQSPITVSSISGGDTYYEISPGKFYRIDNIFEGITLKLLGYVNSTYSSNYKEYLFRIRSTKTDPINITFIDENDTPITIKWANQIEFSLEGGYIYIISIVEDLGVFLKF